MQTFYITPIGVEVGLTSVSLGLIRALERVGLKVGFIKPIAQANEQENGIEQSTHFARAICHIESPPPIPSARVESLLSAGQSDLLMEEIMSLYEQEIAGNFDVIIVEGLASVPQNTYAAPLNAKIARNLEAQTIFVISADSYSAREIVDQLDITIHQFLSEKNNKFAGFIVNKIPAHMDIEKLSQDMINMSQLKQRKLPLLGAIPFNPELTAPRLLDVANHVRAHIDFPGNINHARVCDIVVGARAIANMVDRLRPGALVISPGDRDDVMLATALAALRGIPLAGLLLTCNSKPHPQIQQLCLPAMQSGLSVLSTEHDTFYTASLISHMSNQVPIDDIERMENVLNAIAEHIAVNSLKQLIGEPAERRMSPAAFRYQLIQNARRADKRIVLPEGDEPRTIKAAVICAEKGIARCVLIGKPEVIHQVAESQGVILPSKVEIIDPDDVRLRYVAPMVELRKSKGLTAPMAEKQLEDNIVLATMMLALDEVDGLVSGAVHTTASTIRPALQLIKTAPGAKIVSSVFFMLMPEQVLVYGDCAVNPDPTAEELANIAIQSADSARAFGLSPRVAMISYSTGTSGVGSDVEKVRTAALLAKAARPDIVLDGPLQYDAASVESVGRQKAPNSPVAGRANVFIFPDLNTGNTTYKAVQRSADVVSVGPMLQGLRKPVNDLSRGALVDDIVYTIALTAIQAQQIEKQ
jgi:phosphate acetyltransferase